MTTYTTEGLPGHITVWAPHPKPLLDLVPPSHNSCVRGFTLVPVRSVYSPAHIQRSECSIALENNSAVVETMLERDQLLLSLLSLERLYQTGDHV